MKRLIILGFILTLLPFSNTAVCAQTKMTKIMNEPSKTNENLNARRQSIAAIAALTAVGDLDKLKTALTNGLEAGLTVNETREVLVQLYAYCGFPRSLQAINTLIAVLDERKSRGITDKIGRDASPITSGESKYERGKKTLEKLTGKPEPAPKTGANAFSPELDRFLKEHLFADIFDRDVLNYADRETATIAALVALGGVEPQLESHLNIGMNVGLSKADLTRLINIAGANVGADKAAKAQNVLNKISGKTETMESKPTDDANAIFPKGEKAPAENFTGTVFVQMLAAKNDFNNFSIGSVSFEAGARSHWHTHPAGQTLIVVSGTGLYQEKGESVRTIKKGETITCHPDIEHWHGASPDRPMTHLAITNFKGDKNVVWLKPVTDAEYAGGSK